MMHDPINKIIMQEIGLGVDNYQKVIDQDTREQLKFKEKNIKYSSQNSVVLTKNDIPFDPIESKNLMGGLFDHFSKKLEKEDNVYISRFYDITDKEKGTALEAVVNGKKIKSDYYNNNESLKYLDIIMQLNGSDNINLKQYDTPVKKVTKRKGRV
jgi:hypothetical protein